MLNFEEQASNFIEKEFTLDKKEEIMTPVVETSFQEDDGLSEKERNVIKTCLGTGDQIWKKVEALLAALERGQVGSPKIGEPDFFNCIINTNVKLPKEEWNLCKDVILHYVKIVQEDKKLEGEVAGYLNDYIKGKKEKKEDEAPIGKLATGAKELEQQEYERTGIHPEELNQI